MKELGQPAYNSYFIPWLDSIKEAPPVNQENVSESGEVQ